jgi:oligosaccharide repeat unit polymerase
VAFARPGVVSLFSARRALPAIALWVVILGLPSGAAALFVGTPPALLPPTWVSLLWAAPLALYAILRNAHSRVVGLVWVGWFIVGSLNVVASYAVVGSYWELDVGYADFVYVAFTFFFLLGLVATDLRIPEGAWPKEPNREGFDSFFVVLLATFPLWYAWTMRTAVGSFPLLQGTNLTQQMYELDYGPLYGYSILLMLAALVALDCAHTARNRLSRLIYYSVVPVALLVSILDGKRFNLMLFMAGFLAYQLRLAGPRSRGIQTLRITGGVIAGALVLYIGVLVLRQGLNVDAYAGVTLQLAAVGAEHRDFVYSVNNFVPGQIPNYHWGESALFSTLNSGLLSAFGIDKLQHVLTGSAYAWKSLLGSDFGIRTGIVSELYFAYGWLGLPVMLGVGFLVGLVTRRVWIARTRRGLLFACAAYAILLLAPVSQTTGTTGVLTVLFYAFVLSAFTRRVVSALRPRLWTAAGSGEPAGQRLRVINA